MVNQRELIDRFGDREFLCTLWRKAEKELPSRLEEMVPLVNSSSPDWPVLATKLHKLRGLVANFLCSGNAVSTLVQCETCVENSDLQGLQEGWSDFTPQLQTEVQELNEWLNCP